jgi:hypothetical protein
MKKIIIMATFLNTISFSNIVHSVEKYEGKDVRLANNGNQKEESPLSPYPDLYHPDHQTQQEKLNMFKKDGKDRQIARAEGLARLEELNEKMKQLLKSAENLIEKITTMPDPEK